MKFFHKFIRGIYWRLPGNLQKIFMRFITFGLSFFRGLSGGNRSSDLTWKQFQSQILASQNQYKGIFIQSANIPWNVDLFQRPQHIAMAFARKGYLVIYQTNAWSRDNVQGFRQVQKNVWITSKNIIPDISGAIISVYSTSYMFQFQEGAYDNNVLVYEYIDHIDPKISGSSKQVKILNDLKDFAFSGGVDYIVASAAALYDEAARALGHERVILSQNGVDTAHYRDKKHAQLQFPDYYQEFINKYDKIVGYFGALAPWLWYDEVNKLILSRPDLGFVFIGPDYGDGRSRLVEAENVLCTGPIDYETLPAFAQNFDVCFIPFEPGEIAKTTSPLKLFEYFALEKPVVVTSFMDECVIYPEVFSGHDAKELSQKIDDALKVADDPQFKSKLAMLADENDWDHRVSAYEKVFEGLKQAK